MIKSLKTRIMIMMVVAIVIPLVVVATLSLYQFTQTTEENVHDKLGDLVTLTAAVIEEELNQAHLITSIMSKDQAFLELIEGNEAKRYLVFNYLEDEQKANSDLIETIFITDADGIGVITSSDKDFNADLSGRAYLQEALSGQPAVSDVIISTTTESQIIAIAYPIYQGTKVVGAIGVAVPFANITDHVKSIQVYDSGYAYMFNMDGLTLSHLNPDFEMELVITDAVEDLKPVLENVRNGEAGEVFYNYNGVDKYVRYAPAGKWALAVTADKSDYMSTNIRISWMILAVGVIASILAMAFAYILSNNRIVKPLIKLEALMTLAGNGDLTVESDTKTGDEIEKISDAFNMMIVNQNDIVGKVKQDAIELALSSDDIAESTGQVSDSSENITKSITSVANNSTEQAKSVIETSEVLLQLSSLIQLAKNRAEAAESNVNKSLEVAEEGRGSIETTIQAMSNIENASKNTNESLKILEDLSSKVKGIIGTINSIADQTNMLALNASIEAARAGEHGRGFAVVAEEVRKLAEQTAQESSGISSVVGEMVSRIAEAVESMDDGYKAVQDGVVKAQETDSAFVSIATAVDNMQQDISKIVQVTDDEVASSDEILKLIDTVASLSEVNSANSQEVAAATEEQTALLETIAAGSEEMTAMAEELKELVDRFKLKGEA